MRTSTTIGLAALAACTRGTGEARASDATDLTVAPPGTVTRPPDGTTAPPGTPAPAESPMVAAGRDTFRYDTFGDEAYWGDTLHEAIAGKANGGVGDPTLPRLIPIAVARAYGGKRKKAADSGTADVAADGAAGDAGVDEADGAAEDAGAGSA